VQDDAAGDVAYTEKVPGLQSRHVEEPDIPDPVEYVPIGQLEHAAVEGMPKPVE
jgi:hypothetical protein